MSLAHAQHLQRVCYFSHQSSCLKTPTTTGVAVQRLCSLKAAVKSPCWMAIVHPILPSPLRPQKPVLVRVRNSIATCTLPQVDRTLIGTGICRKERACEQAWLACCLFRPCSRQEKFLSLWRKCRRYDRLRDHSTCNSIKESNLSTMHLNPQKAVFMACVFHLTRRAQRVLDSIHKLTHYSRGTHVTQAYFWVTQCHGRFLLKALLRECRARFQKGQCYFMETIQCILFIY